MANRTRFGGYFAAVDYNYGGGQGFPPALVVQTGPTSSPIVNPGTVTLVSGQGQLTDGNIFTPLNTNAPVNIGNGSNSEAVTPTAVTNASSVVPGQASFTGTFTKLHGIGDTVSSATFGLQEALNDAKALGGGIVVIDWAWTKAGGTDAIKNAATVPSGVTLQDNRT